MCMPTCAPNLRLELIPTESLEYLDLNSMANGADHFWSDTKKGAAATADGFIPLVDPFSSFYDTKKDPATKWSKRGGTFAYMCVMWPRSVMNAKAVLDKIRPPNPPPFVSPFPPMPKGPFYGGGQLWPS